MAAHFINKSFCFASCRVLLRGDAVNKTKVVSPCLSVRHLSMEVKYPMVIRRKLLNSCSSTSIIASRSLSSADNTRIEDYIPAPPVPPVPEDAIEVVSALDQLEPTLVSQGLGGWTPVGILQHGLEWLHVSAGLPWWATISVASLIARFLLFPLFVKSQQNAVNLHNHSPQMQTLQMKITEARQNGNHFEVSKLTTELMQFMKDKNCSPFKSMLVPLAQAPIFISFFIGLRRMANLPIESFKDGGMLWFTDLTVTDPYFILPIITCVTLFITIEIGAEGGIQMRQLQTARYVVRAIPLIMFPFIMNFPAAILCYWVTTNGVTLLQMSLLKFTKIREFLNIPKRIQFKQEDLPMKKKGFVESVKDTWANSKATREMADRAQRDHRNFNKAGMGPVPKTYKFDPTKQKSF